MHSRNFKLSEAMEKHMISMACEAEKLRSELANAGKAMAAATAANSGPGHVIHQQNLEPGYGGNPLSDSYAVHQGTFDPSSNYGIAAGPPGPYDVQTQPTHS
ncbi:hypothetical protein CDL12_29935 [Handroanthus impetiginosus]|uniref:Uncharacterized protein n=1 Tax=Handroanthus impetiginosus TaxID=429701 RepID=A0A2G9FX18_9LAMI|nr:hypothetical protein CDL12_29935 [Handroanthus impetiginosus]